MFVHTNLAKKLNGIFASEEGLIMGLSMLFKPWRWGEGYEQERRETFTKYFGEPLGLDESILRSSQQALVTKRLDEMLGAYRRLHEELEALFDKNPPEVAGASLETFQKVREEVARITQNALLLESQIREATTAARGHGYSVTSEAIQVRGWLRTIRKKEYGDRIRLVGPERAAAVETQRQGRSGPRNAGRAVDPEVPAATPAEAAVTTVGEAPADNGELATLTEAPTSGTQPPGSDEPPSSPPVPEPDLRDMHVEDGPVS